MRRDCFYSDWRSFGIQSFFLRSSFIGGMEIIFEFWDKLIVRGILSKVFRDK